MYASVFYNINVIGEKNDYVNGRKRKKERIRIKLELLLVSMPFHLSDYCIFTYIQPAMYMFTYKNNTTFRPKDDTSTKDRCIYKT